MFVFVCFYCVSVNACVWVCIQTCKLLCLPSVMVLCLRFFLVRSEDEFPFLYRFRLLLPGFNTALGLSNVLDSSRTCHHWLLRPGVRNSSVCPINHLSFQELSGRAQGWYLLMEDIMTRQDSPDAIGKAVAFLLENSSPWHWPWATTLTLCVKLRYGEISLGSFGSGGSMTVGPWWHLHPRWKKLGHPSPLENYD